ncbi:MAG TPA: hypothetical protein VMW46_12875 [Candidatus Desulfaltia sp.]|nr:hypothetical protein [Candidatus Desulfaltia sp.]
MIKVRLFYHLIVLYLSLHLLWYLVRRKKIWSQAAAALVLTLFLLRLFLIK